MMTKHAGRKLPVLTRDDLCGITWKQLQCFNCGSTRMLIVEGKGDAIEVYEGGQIHTQQAYPLQISCRNCKTIIRQEGIT